MKIHLFLSLIVKNRHSTSLEYKALGKEKHYLYLSPPDCYIKCKIMKKLVLIVALLSFVFSSFLNAQCSEKQSVFVHNPETQASIVAAADDSIEEMVDDMTGEIYFVQQIENPWDGELVYINVVFDVETSSFIDSELYAFNGEEKVDTKGQKPSPSQKDTCIEKQPKGVKSQGQLRIQPRRSSRVKLAENF